MWCAPESTSPKSPSGKRSVVPTANSSGIFARPPQWSRSANSFPPKCSSKSKPTPSSTASSWQQQKISWPINSIGQSLFQIDFATRANLPANPYPVLQHRLAIRLHRHIELRCKRFHLLRLKRGGNDLPISSDRFIQLYRHRRLLMIPQGNLIRHLVDPVRDFLVIRLFALRHNVKRIPDFYIQEFVLRGVLNAVFPNK